MSGIKPLDRKLFIPSHGFYEQAPLRINHDPTYKQWGFEYNFYAGPEHYAMLWEPCWEVSETITDQVDITKVWP